MYTQKLSSSPKIMIIFVTLLTSLMYPFPFVTKPFLYLVDYLDFFYIILFILIY